MWRFLAGAAACFLLLTGAFLLWQSRAQGPSLPAAPTPLASAAPSLFGASQPLEAPEASPKNRQEKRFSRYDKNKDGKVESEEYFAARRKNFEKLDLDHNGALSFQEYAVKGIEKFQGADNDRSGWLLSRRIRSDRTPAAKAQDVQLRPD